MRKTTIVVASFLIGIVSTVFAAATYDATIQSRATSMFNAIKSNADVMDPRDVSSYYTLVHLNILSLIQVLTSLDTSITAEIEANAGITGETLLNQINNDTGTDMPPQNEEEDDNNSTNENPDTPTVSNSNTVTVILNQGILYCGNPDRNDYTSYSPVDKKVIIKKDYCKSKGGKVWASCDQDRINQKVIDTIKDGDNFSCSDGAQNSVNTPGTTPVSNTPTPVCVDLQYEFQCNQAMNGNYKQLKYANGNTENITSISDCTTTTFRYMTTLSSTSMNGYVGAGWKACSVPPVSNTTANTATTSPIAASVATRLYGIPAGANGYSITRGAKIHGDYVFSQNASNISCQVWYSKNAANSLGDFITFAIENGQSNTSSKVSDAFDIDTASINTDANSFVIQSKCGGFINGTYTNVQDRQVVTLITRKPVIEYFRLIQSADEAVIEWSATDTSAELCTLKKSNVAGGVQFQVAYPAKNIYRETKKTAVESIYQLSCPNKNGNTLSENIII